MIVMPSNSSGWFWHSLARETRKLGHLYSPGGQRGPWPWFPYALDNGAFACWNPADNSFDDTKWKQTEIAWNQLLFWSQVTHQRPLWAIVPDRPGDWNETCRKWSAFASVVVASGIPLAVAVQDGATAESVRTLNPTPEVIAIGGSTEWKWETVEMWAREFPRVHLLRCNMPTKLQYLESLGIESCDGTGWNRGDRKKTMGLERWLRSKINFGRVDHELWPHVCRAKRDTNQEAFA